MGNESILKKIRALRAKATNAGRNAADSVNLNRPFKGTGNAGKIKA